jgi:hypothetical protein
VDFASGSPATSCLDQKAEVFLEVFAQAAWALGRPRLADPGLAAPEFAVALEFQFAVT